jgi:hypothetical protein
MSFISMLDVARGINYTWVEGVVTGRGRGITLDGAEPTAPALAKHQTVGRRLENRRLKSCHVPEGIRSSRFGVGASSCVHN